MTAIATIVVAIPLCSAAVIAAALLRHEAMSFDAASIRGGALCASGLVTDSIDREVRTPGSQSGNPPRALIEEECKEQAGKEKVVNDQIYSVITRPKRLGNIIVRGLPDPDKVISCRASYGSSVIIPELSLWPLTDPEMIGYRIITHTGHVTTGIPRTLSSSEVEKIAAVQRTLNARVFLLLASVVAIVGLVAATVWIATGHLLRPVEAIRREVADITEHDLTRRVPVPRARNEIARLATTMNTTLDRLQTAVEDNRRFVADASHELRSPIAALRAELEIATTHPELADWTAVVDGALADTYRLQDLAGDLLLLTRLDHSLAATATDTVDLTALVHDETTRRRSRHTIITDMHDLPASVQGSHALLARLLGNLLDNAERHATRTITVRLNVTDHHAELDVIDDGPGIPLEDRERVFDRFTRLDNARARSTGGTGLGLSIARRIAATHHGTLHAVDHHNGARLTATFPLTLTRPTG